MSLDHPFPLTGHALDAGRLYYFAWDGDITQGHTAVLYHLTDAEIRVERIRRAAFEMFCGTHCSLDIPYHRREALADGWDEFRARYAEPDPDLYCQPDREVGWFFTLQ